MTPSRLAGFALVLLALLGLGSSERATAAPRAHVATHELYWGAWIGDQLTGQQAPWDMSAVSAFESMVGKRVSLIHFAAPFADCSGGSSCSFYSFPTTPFNEIRQHGSIPFFSWSSSALPETTNEPAFRLAKVTAGAYDTYIRSWASSAAAWGHPFFLRFNWEMNGSWFPWAESANGNQRGDYVRAWRHVHDIFTSVGATNVTWVWCPNIDPASQYTSLSELYPGNAYVDWTCLDGYNWDTPWTSFSSLFHSTYAHLTQLAPGKPIVVAETASAEKGGSKAAWIRDLLDTQLPSRFPLVEAFLWFERYDSGMAWPVETSPSATAAFHTGIALPTYASNSFGNLGGSPIRPLP